MFVFSKKVLPEMIQPKFLADVQAVLATDLARWLITHGYRSWAEQDALHKIHLAGGPRAAPAGSSAHNYGLAIDVALDRDPKTTAWEMDWDARKADWQRLFAALKKHPRLQSGIHFADGAHIQRYRWTRYKGKTA